MHRLAFLRRGLKLREMGMAVAVAVVVVARLACCLLSLYL